MIYIIMVVFCVSVLLFLLCQLGGGFIDHFKEPLNLQTDNVEHIITLTEFTVQKQAELTAASHLNLKLVCDNSEHEKRMNYCDK